MAYQTQKLATQLKFTLIITTLAIALLVIAATSLSNYKPQLTTQIFDRNGNLIFEIFDSEHRIFVPLEKIPKHLQLATIAAEDKRFYFHRGIDPIATLRAAKETFFSGQIQGGSTITQQYVRNAHLSSERTLTRKIKEVFLATFLESFTSKEKILEKYLNQVSYGGINFGVETATRYYFGKNVSQLTLTESAFLASLPKAPTAFSPKNSNVSDIKKRQELVLEKMKNLGFITEQEKSQAKLEKLQFAFSPLAFSAPHFSLMVKEELIKKFGPKLVQKGGLKVKTTLDLKIQQKSEKIVALEVAKLKNLKVTNGASLVANPATGEILALVGSADYFAPGTGNFNVITQGLRQPGSAIKPIMYSAAFEAGYTAATIIFDIPTVFYNQWEKYAPKNYDNKFHGPLPLRYALGNSYNVPAIRMLATIGPNSFISQAKKMGIENLEKQGMGLSLTVGGGAIKPIELAQGYQVLAANGVKKELFGILQVEDSEGNVLFSHKDTGQKALDERIAFLLADILSDNQARSWAFGQNSLLNIPNYRVAVKTGTSDDKRDNWAIGFTPNALILAWVGNNDNSPMNPALTSGITGATPIWHRITQEALLNLPSTWYVKPSGIVETQVDFLTGKLACGGGKTQVEFFIEGTQPLGCGKAKRVLVQKVDGVENVLGEIAPGQEVVILQNNSNQPNSQLPNQGIPAAVFEIKVLPDLKDPLMEKTGKKSVIYYTG